MSSGDLTVGIHGGPKGANAIVTERGELVTAPLSFSTPYYVQVAAADTAYEVVPAEGSQCFVITGLLIASDKAFATSVVSETLVIYEANAADLDTSLKTIVQVDLLRNDRITPTGLNLLVNEARTLVAYAPTSAAVDVTIAGYYINA